MNMMTTLVAPPNRLAALDLLRRFGRVEVEQAIEDMIALLDAADGDADLNDGIAADAGECCASDIDDDVAWTEWLSRGRHKLYAGGWEPSSHHEDDEEDDAQEDDGEDAGVDDAGELTAHEVADQRRYAVSGPDDDEDDDQVERSPQPLTLNLCAANEA